MTGEVPPGASAAAAAAVLHGCSSPGGEPDHSPDPSSIESGEGAAATPAPGHVSEKEEATVSPVSPLSAHPIDEAQRMDETVGPFTN